jgi:hypothetical protein
LASSSGNAREWLTSHKLSWVAAIAGAGMPGCGRRYQIA